MTAVSLQGAGSRVLHANARTQALLGPHTDTFSLLLQQQTAGNRTSCCEIMHMLSAEWVAALGTNCPMRTMRERGIVSSIKTSHLAECVERSPPSSDVLSVTAREEPTRPPEPEQKRQQVTVC